MKTSKAFGDAIIASSLIITLIIVTLVLFWPGLSGPFLLDDRHNISPLEFKTLDVESLLNVAASNTSGILGRPISALSLALTQHFSGPSAYAFKYTNLMIHCVIGLLLFWLTLRVLQEIKPRLTEHQSWIIAGIIALLWLIHPLNVSTVMYAVQRMAQLAILFSAAAVLSYVIGRQALATDNIKVFWLGVLGLSVFIPLALFSKENGVLIPLYVIALELFIFSRKSLSSKAFKHLAAFQSLWIIIPISLGALYFITHHEQLLVSYQVRDFDLSERLLTQTHVVLFYIQLILLPSLSQMSLFHDSFPVTRSLDLSTLLSILAIVTILAAAYALRKKHPILAFGIYWFFLSHLLESTIFPLEMVFEHRNYLAMYGLLLPLGYYTAKMIPHTSVRKAFAFTSLLIIIIIILGSQTFSRATVWSSTESLRIVTQMDRPNSVRANSALANLLLQRGDVENAFKFLGAAENIAPHEPGVPLHKILAYCYTDEIPKQQIEAAQQKLSNEKFTPYALSGIDILIQRKFTNGCPPLNAVDLIKLTESALISTKRNSNQTDTTYLLMMNARTHLLNDNVETALNSYDLAFEIDNTLVQALYEKTDFLISLNRLVEAKATLSFIRSTKQGQLITERSKINQLQDLIDEASTAQQAVE